MRPAGPAGTATTVRAGTSLRTTLPAATTAWSPMRQGPTTMALVAIQTPRPMTMSWPSGGIASCRAALELVDVVGARQDADAVAEERVVTDR